MSRATRDLILAGAAPAPYAVKALDGAEVILRALTVPEANEIRSVQLAGVSLPGDVIEDALAAGAGVGRARRRPDPAAAPATTSVDLAAMSLASGKARIMAAAYGLVDPPATREELEASSNFAAVDEIGGEVMKRSGLGRGQAAAIAAFRDEPAGPDGPGDTDGGGTAGEDAG